MAAIDKLRVESYYDREALIIWCIYPQLYRWVIKSDTKEWVQMTNDNMHNIVSNLHKYSFASEEELIEKFSKK